MNIIYLLIALIPLIIALFSSYFIECEPNWAIPPTSSGLTSGVPTDIKVMKICKNWCFNNYQTESYRLEVENELTDGTLSKKTRCYCDINNCNPDSPPNITCNSNWIFTKEENPSDKFVESCNDEDYKEIGILTCNITDMSGQMREACLTVYERTIIKTEELNKVCGLASPKVTFTLTCELGDVTEKFLRYNITGNFEDSLYGSPTDDVIIDICKSNCQGKYDSTTFRLEPSGEDSSKCYCDINNCNPSD